MTRPGSHASGAPGAGVRQSIWSLRALQRSITHVRRGTAVNPLRFVQLSRPSRVKTLHVRLNRRALHQRVQQRVKLNLLQARIAKVLLSDQGWCTWVQLKVGATQPTNQACQPHEDVLCVRRARALADHESQNQHRAEQGRLVRLVLRPLQREKVDDDV